MATNPLGGLADWADSASGRGCLVALFGWAAFLAVGAATYWLVAETGATGATLFWGVVIAVVVGVALLALVAAIRTTVRKRP
jgi:apolipoprotein N-acyltransferase